MFWVVRPSVRPSDQEIMPAQVRRRYESMFQALTNFSSFVRPSVRPSVRAPPSQTRGRIYLKLGMHVYPENLHS